jgi:hypothetical protein
MLHHIFNIPIPRPFWTPAEITSEAWFDADDPLSITESANRISQWNDKSGNNRHATQPTGSIQPDYVASDPVFTGRATVKASTGGAYLDTVSSFSVKRVYLVVYYDDTSLLFGNHNAIFAGSVGSNSRLTGRSNEDKVWDGPRDNKNFDKDGITLRNGSRVDSTAEANGLPMPGDIFNITALVTKTQTFRLMGNSASYTTWPGGLGEIIFTDGTEGIETQQKMEGYLAWKWGLVTKLPIDHPYRFDGTLFGHGILWNPALLTTELWLDAASQGTITEAAGAVSQWDDKSGNDNHVTQNTGADQPSLVSGAINGINAVNFIDRNDYMDGSIPLDAKWVVVLLQYNGTPTFSQALGSQTSTGGENYTIQYRGDLAADRWQNSYYTNGNSISNVGADVNVNPTIVVRDGMNLVGLDLQVGGDRGINGRGWDGYLGEVIYGNQTLDTATRQLLEGYLAWKWGTVASLDASHPYKTDGSLFGY